MQLTKHKILYVFDPLCGWCYGFSPVVIKLKEKYGSHFQFDVISGGMVTGDRVGPITEISDYISNAHKYVEEQTGVKFGKHFLEKTLYNPEVTMSSEPPSVAFAIFSEINPDKAPEIAHEIQKLLYFDGQDLTIAENYSTLCDKYGIEFKGFNEKFNADTYKEMAWKQFRNAGYLNVRSFPTLLVERSESSYIPLTVGYSTYETLAGMLEKVLTPKG